MKLNYRIRLASLLAVSLSMTAVYGEAAKKDIVDTAVEAGSFKTLATALDAAGLIDALKSDGPFTVFAPTDEAFAKLPKGTVENLLKPENLKSLVGILKFHVVSGKVPASKVTALTSATTLNGQRVDVVVKGSEVKIDGAKVLKTDIACSNGIIHVVDSVLLPASDNLPATAIKAGTFKTLVAAAKAAGLVEALSAEGPLTVFAPTDDAFAKLPAGTVDSLLKPENRDQLAAILKYHVVAGRIYSDDALKAKKAKSLQGGNVFIAAKDGGAYVNDAKLIATDIDASNGVIHVVDSVLMPPKKVTATDAKTMIEHAIARGSKLYNLGHHQACADIYESTMTEMVGYTEAMPPLLMKEVGKAMTHASRSQCATSKAWALRHGLDSAYTILAQH